MSSINKKLILEIEVTAKSPVLDMEASYQDEEGEEEVILYSKESVAALVMDSIVGHVDGLLNPYDTDTELNHVIGDRIDVDLDEWALENLLKEIKDRTDERDNTALEILIAAKKRVVEDLKKYQFAIKVSLIALKPFYLITLIDLMTQKPEMF